MWGPVQNKAADSDGLIGFENSGRSWCNGTHAVRIFKAYFAIIRQQVQNRM